MIGRDIFVVSFVIPSVVLGATTAYAIARYVVFGPVEVSNGLYLFNKAVAVGSVVLLGWSLSLGAAARLWPRLVSCLWWRKYLGISALALATTHILLTLPIFTESYFPNWYTESGTLLPLVDFAMLAGVLSWVLLLPPGIASFPGTRESMSPETWRAVQFPAKVALFFLLLHQSYGIEGWLKPAGWYGGMPPFTLISAIVVFGVFGIRLLGHRRGARPRVEQGGEVADEE